MLIQLSTSSMSHRVRAFVHRWPLEVPTSRKASDAAAAVFNRTRSSSYVTRRKHLFDARIDPRRRTYAIGHYTHVQNSYWNQRAVYGDMPRFIDSKDDPPLQAADMLAYWVRETMRQPALTPTRFNMRFPWPRVGERMQGVNIYCSPDMLLRNFNRMLLSTTLTRADARYKDAVYIMALEKLPY